MRNQVLNIEQMQHLKELGIDTSKASMEWMYVQSKADPTMKTEAGLLIGAGGHEIPEDPEFEAVFTPAFTLQDIIEILPESIMDDKNEMYKGTQYWHHLTITPHWEVSYDEGKGSLESIEYFTSESLLEAAYQMLCWCAENGYLKGGEK